MRRYSSEAAAVSRFREMALMREQLRNAEFKSRSSARRDTEVGGARRVAGDTAAGREIDELRGRAWQISLAVS